MSRMLRAALAAALTLAPAAAMAQMVIEAPPMMDDQMGYSEPLTEQDAMDVAMANGMVSVDDVDWDDEDGTFTVDGEDATGDDIELVVDGMSGAIVAMN